MKGIPVIFLRYSQTYESNTTSAVLVFTTMASSPRYSGKDAMIPDSPIWYSVGLFCFRDSPTEYQIGLSRRQEWTS